VGLDHIIPISIILTTDRPQVKLRLCCLQVVDRQDRCSSNNHHFNYVAFEGVLEYCDISRSDAQSGLAYNPAWRIRNYRFETSAEASVVRHRPSQTRADFTSCQFRPKSLVRSRCFCSPQIDLPQQRTVPHITLRSLTIDMDDHSDINGLSTFWPRVKVARAHVCRSQQMQTLIRNPSNQWLACERVTG
jgi:hypothetical protein